MNEKLKTVEEENLSTHDEILRALTGKVAEMGSAVNEGNVQLKKVNEMASHLPYFDKRLEAMEDWAVKMKQNVEENGRGLKEGVNNLGLEVKKLADKVSTPVEAMSALQDELVNHARLFEKPFRKEVHHRHFLGWPVVVVFATVMISVFMFGLWRDARYELSATEENDIKYRYVKLNADTLMQARMNLADEAWRADPDQFRKSVETDEELLSVNTTNYLRKMQLDSETRAVRKPKGR